MSGRSGPGLARARLGAARRGRRRPQRARARWVEPESAGKTGGQDVWTWGNLAGGDAGSLPWTRAVPRAGVWLHGWWDELSAKLALYWAPAIASAVATAVPAEEVRPRDVSAATTLAAHAGSAV